MKLLKLLIRKKKDSSKNKKDKIIYNATKSYKTSR